jgi:CRISPR/Cas system CSM-associated protein Csm3 (group 7 of RAMP superfamily)
MTLRRYQINGSLTLTSALHLGSGKAESHEKLKVDNEKILVSAVAKDASGKAYLPGSSLKGSIRSWLRRYLNINFDNVFGNSKQDGIEHEGRAAGKVAFTDSFVSSLPTFNVQSPAPVHWNVQSATAVEVAVSIDPVTRTARDKFLRHFEYVPAGTVFSVSLEANQLAESDLSTLVVGLMAFNEESQPLALGAFTKDGWGRATWQLERIKVITEDGIRSWLRQPQVTHYRTLYANYQNQQKVIDEAKVLLTTKRKPILTVDLELNFDSPFLVNDVLLVKEQKSTQDLAPDFQPKRNIDNRVYLPARSFRGAFRHQAERIVNTVQPDQPNTASSRQPKSVSEALFGVTGYRTVLEISHFVQKRLDKKEKVFNQEFVAIDRFTGGNALGAKFKATTIFGPQLVGTLELDLSRLKHPASLGLLAYALRDLVEGDITFGFGSSIGYGSCKAKIVSVRTTGLEIIGEKPLATLLVQEVQTKSDVEWFANGQLHVNGDEQLKKLTRAFQAERGSHA